MNRYESLAATVAIVFLFAGNAMSTETPSKPDKTTQWMVQQETAWAEQSCGSPWVLSDLLASDFQGTSPKGVRYTKPTGTPVYDPTTFHTDCRLLSADVRFFGSDVAVAYGAESSVGPLPDSKHERRCLAWTDTWLKRHGKWQIIAAHDTRIDCPST
jgi:hypothetical protein